jgi:hypothetical protein
MADFDAPLTHLLLWVYSAKTSNKFVSVTHLEFAQGVNPHHLSDFTLIYGFFPHVTHMAWTIEDGDNAYMDLYLGFWKSVVLPDLLQFFVLHILCDEHCHLERRERVERTVSAFNWPRERWAVVVDNLDWSPLNAGTNVWSEASDRRPLSL